MLTSRALPDVLPTPKLLGPLLQHSRSFILIQNGIDIHQDLQNAAPDATIISGCAWIDTTAVDGGRRVVHSSMVSAPFSPSSVLIIVV